MSPPEPWLAADTWACFRFAIDYMRKKGLREGKFEPVNDDERQYLDEVKRADGDKLNKQGRHWTPAQELKAL